MISDTPIIEFLIVKNLDETYYSYVVGLNGRVVWELFDELRSIMESDPYTSHPDIKEIISEFENERDGAIVMTAELYEVETEVQYNEVGEMNVLSGYYDLKNCKLVQFDRLTSDFETNESA